MIGTRSADLSFFPFLSSSSSSSSCVPPAPGREKKKGVGLATAIKVLGHFLPSLRVEDGQARIPVLLYVSLRRKKKPSTMEGFLNERGRGLPF
jgi:hypothetical protein